MPTTLNIPTPTPPDATHHNRRTLGVVFLILFIDLMGFSIIFPLFPEMLDYYLAGERDYFGILASIVNALERLAPGYVTDPTFFITVLFGGILGSLYSVLQFIFSPLWGRWSDKVGRKKVLTITLSFTLLSYVAWVFAGDFWILVAARIIGGAMSGNISVATAAVSDVTSRENRAKGMALVGIAFGLGFLLGPALGGLCSQWNLLDTYPTLEAWGINPFSVPAALALLLTTLNLLWLRAKFPETLSSGTQQTTQEQNEESRITSLFNIANAKIKRTCWVYFIFMLSFSGMEFTLTFLAVERFSYTPMQNGIMFVYIGFWLIMTQGVIVRRMAPKVGEKRLAIAGIICGIIALTTLSLLASKASFYVALLFLALGVGMSSPSLSSMVSLYADEGNQGRYLGIFRSAGALARAIGPFSAALVYFLAGSPIAYGIGAVLLLLPLALAAQLPQPDKTEVK